MKRTALLFPGQGVQCLGMGKDFYESFAIARQLLEEADEILHFNFKKLLFEGPEEKLKETSFAQLAVFLVSAMILKVLQHEAPDFRYEVVSGLSLGEYTALYAAQRLSFQHCLKLIQKRGEWMSDACKKNPGGMMAVLGLSSFEVEEILKPLADHRVWAANFNSPTQVVISGTQEGLMFAETVLKAKKAKVIFLKVEGAFHSPLMEPAELLLKEMINSIAFLNDQKIPIVMNVTGDYVYETSTIQKLLIQQLTKSVRWQKGIESMVDHGIEEFVEIGTGKSLTQMNARIGVKQPSYSIEKVENFHHVLEALCNS